MSRQTKFKLGDKVRRTSHLANGTHTYGTVDTVVEVTVAGTYDSYDIYRNSEGFYSENNDHGCTWCDAENYELVERAENKND